jgi:hypothetical protein
MKIIAHLLTPIALLFVLQSSAYASAERSAAMRELYERVKGTLDSPTLENPFYLKASSAENIESGEAAVYVPYSLDTVSDALNNVANWCDILPQHINVKACTHDQTGSAMSLYMGRKFYEAPDDAFELKYQFKSIRSDNYFSAIATADDGPLNTSNYRLELEFISVDNKTFGRIFVSNKLSWLSKKGMEVYLATLGKDKQGIKVVQHDKMGNPVYSRGSVAVAERNLVRYYLAFMTFFAQAGENEPEQRYLNQLSDWFDRTEIFPQLHELDKKEYMKSKVRERENQLELQQNIDTSG